MNTKAQLFEHGNNREKQRNCKRQERTETAKPDIRKMLKYTAKKILWLVNYSLSFSKKDEGKEIGIKILGCLVILQSLSLLFFIIFRLLEIILINPFLILGFFILTGIFIFKKEIKNFLNSKKIKTRGRYETKSF